MKQYKLIIAGSRNVTDIALVYKALDYFNFNEGNVAEIVSGGARGVDTLGEQVALALGIPVKRFPADWDKYGKSAGYKRNQDMANYADALLAIWDCFSKGTYHMISIMHLVGKMSYVINLSLAEGINYGGFNR
jgi:hypothetical protein